MERDLALFKIESLIIDKRFVAYQAKRDLIIGAHGGNHESRMEEINREIEVLMAGLENKERLANEDPYAINWDQVPEEYNYVATDSDGRIFAYRTEPYIPSNRSRWKCDEMEWEDLPIARGNNPDWKNSLRKRPGA